MDVSTRGRLRRIWFHVHLWIGVGLALALIPLSLSGSYLVWRDQIDRAIHPARFAVTGPAAHAPSVYLDAAQAAFGDRAVVAGVRLPPGSDAPVIVTGAASRAPAERRPSPAGAPGRTQTLTAWLDPGTAKVLEVANVRQGVSAWMHDLHGQFFVFGGEGRRVVGWLGWLMLVSCISGLWLWWPRTGSAAKGLRWRRTPDPLQNLHHRVGFWIAGPLAVLCLTGSLISFPSFTRGLAAVVAPVSLQQPRRGLARAPVPRTELTVDGAAAEALSAYPGGRLVSLTLPTRGGDAPAWRAEVRTQGGALQTVAIEDARGGQARTLPERARLGGDRLIRLNRQLHGGDDMPLAWKLVITLAGLAPAALGLTGAIVWARRQRRRLLLRGRATAVAEPSPAE
jgi:uncharacterized iron-regulated membrane protein